MDFFLNHRERGMVSIRFSSYLHYRNCKRLREFEEKEISSKAVEVIVNNKEKKSKEELVNSCIRRSESHL